MSEDTKNYRSEAFNHDTPLKQDSLVGSHFLARSAPGGVADGGRAGMIVAEPAPGVYLCEMIEWIGGTYNHQELFRLEDMFDGWRFYDDAEWASNDYRAHVSAKWDRLSKEEDAQND